MVSRHRDTNRGAGPSCLPRADKRGDSAAGTRKSTRIPSLALFESIGEFQRETELIGISHRWRGNAEQFHGQTTRNQRQNTKRNISHVLPVSKPLAKGSLKNR